MHVLLACGSTVLFFYLWFIFSLFERKNEPQKEEKYRCENHRPSTA